MYSQNILKWIVLGSALVADFASAAPAEVPCDDISKYTTEVSSSSSFLDYWYHLRVGLTHVDSSLRIQRI
jgi:hypothetical protein